MTTTFTPDTDERYERLDDGSRAEHARLKKVWQLWWSPEDGASTVQPGDGGIHRVGNPADEAAVSVHLYGPRTGNVDGRDYDPPETTSATGCRPERPPEACFAEASGTTSNRRERRR